MRVCSLSPGQAHTPCFTKPTVVSNHLKYNDSFYFNHLQALLFKEIHVCLQLLDRSWLYFPLTSEIPPFFVGPCVLPTLHAMCSKPGQPNLPDCSTSLLEVWWPHSGHHWGSGLHERLGDKYELLMWITNTKSLCILKLVWLQGGCLEAFWPSENQRICLVWSEMILRKS